MGKTIIVSNRLPLQISIENDLVTGTPSVGGLATGMKSVHKKGESLWIGWSGLMEEDIADAIKPRIDEVTAEAACVTVPLSKSDIDGYYYGFSNKTIWPLFHYFTEFAEYKNEHWETYKAVNRKFAKVVAAHLKPGDKVWVHDYQLLLLPQYIKEQFPDVMIGFFLHIPFPSFEVFRISPWRTELLEGLLGADLIGFHTYDYVRHFFSSVRRLVGHDINFNEIVINNRAIRADIFPMGIDYVKFHRAAVTQQRKSLNDRTELRRQMEKHQLVNPEVRFVLSIDRLDYTKGIGNRLLAFEDFLKRYPDYRGKATLVMLCVPSRENVEQYQLIKNEVDGLVGRINGKYSTVNWTPIWYFYRSMPFENLIDLYSLSNVALLTPIRDGMNLVAKEYVACRIDSKGVLILSELTGAAKEMSEAILINPNNIESIADALHEALSMPDEEQFQRIETMQTRLKRYNVEKWASDFMQNLHEMTEIQNRQQTRKISEKLYKTIVDKYSQANRRILFLDYDGTLVGFKNKPSHAKPTPEVYAILDKLAADTQNLVVLVSGRDKETFDRWFGGKNYFLIAEHGAWSKAPRGKWEIIQKMDTQWKNIIRPILEFYQDRTPGTFLEEKTYSLVWHYRKADPELGIARANELKDQLTSIIANHDLEILEGSKVIEVKNSGINKGKAALRVIQKQNFGFIIGIGDDWTDEYLFKELPNESITIKVGGRNTIASYSLDSYTDVLRFLNGLD